MPNSRNHPKTVRKLTLNDIMGLHDSDDAMLLTQLNDTFFGFEKFLKDRGYMPENNKKNFQVFFSVLSLIHKACSIQLKGYFGQIRKLLKVIIECEDFLFNDVLSVIHEKLEHKNNDLPTLVLNYICILKAIIKFEITPNEKVLDYAYPTLQNVLNTMKSKRFNNLENCQDQYDLLKRQVDRYYRSSVTTPEPDDMDDEAELFRQLSIFPLSEDITNVVMNRPPVNIIDRPYKSVTQYLSVHFRLMREDMLRSFRNGVRACDNPNEAFKLGCRMYERVTAKFPPKYDVRGILYDLIVETDNSIDWSKKTVLMPGNIVCLSSDNFKNDIHFGTIKEEPKSNTSNFKQAKVKILMENSTDLLKTGQDDYLMFEPSAYFECYKHVLSAIKDFDKNTLPLSDFLVLFDYESWQPQYLLEKQMNHIGKYCLYEEPLVFENNGTEAESLETDNEGIQDAKVQAFEPKHFDPVKYEEWPTAEELGLDVQQHAAFQLCLSKKVAVVQGPPGTGKTFIGAKVVKALLQNVPLKPIVIACLTNQALDQFLEKIHVFQKQVVRLGSQSQSSILEPYTMENLLYAVNHIKCTQMCTSFNMTATLKKSVEYIRKYAPQVLEVKAGGEANPEWEVFKHICRELNQDFKYFNLCESDYLNDDALNLIIPSVQKKQLQKTNEKKDASKRNLSSCVLEWLCKSRGSVLKEECAKVFDRLKKKDRIHNGHFSAKDNVWSLDLGRRFECFYSWREKAIECLKRKIDDNQHQYAMKKDTVKNPPPDQVKTIILENALVVGVTTTGASKYRDLLRSVQPAILIIEEAAEVLESHIIASLQPTTQQLILIGDHKQLRPLPYCNELAESYHLNISMFERLFNNYAPSETLSSQHRMKPIISDLLVNQYLYPELQNYKNVFEYADVKGVASSLFFLNHSHREDELSSSTSSSNVHEAEMAASLAKYFCRMEYESKDITILATYAAQVTLIQTFLVGEEIFVTTVDNYQGKENEIIIVSFVRNNSRNVIGFLKENNRVCVALSRARKAMFCLGNFTLYAEKSALWKDVVNKLTERNMIGDKLPLLCANHNKECFVESAEEITAFASEGCKEKCSYMLPCGHACERRCHYDDNEHLLYKCIEPCEKLISEGKICPRKCYERCKRSKKEVVYLACGHEGSYSRDGSIVEKCLVEVQKQLPCLHFDTIPCCTDLKTHKCRGLVDLPLSCGHVKKVLCHKSNYPNILCVDLKTVTGPCGHRVEVPCHPVLQDQDIQALCKNACGELLKCGHPCVGECCYCKEYGIHACCRDNCEQVLNCGHICEGFCCSPCPPCKRDCSLSCEIHPKYSCANKCFRYCVHCEEPCGRVCPHAMCDALCYEKCTVEPCQEPCEETLACGHKCVGFCGEECPHLCRVCHAEDLNTGEDLSTDRFVMLLDCDHVIEAKCLEKHLDECVDSFVWLTCPICSKPIYKSMRYKAYLQRAKENVRTARDGTTEMEQVHFVLNTMYGIDNIIPSQFSDVTRKVNEILHKDKPESGTLHILHSCVNALSELVAIRKNWPEDIDVSVEYHFENILLWVCNHLTFASYQQLDELDKTIIRLKERLQSG